jgi:hypothetical protein
MEVFLLLRYLFAAIGYGAIIVAIPMLGVRYQRINGILTFKFLQVGAALGVTIVFIMLLLLVTGYIGTWRGYAPPITNTNNLPN